MLVGTRALLGEGWNCPPLNVLVDLTVATTGVVRPADARPLAAARPGRPGEGRLQLGRRLRRAGPRPRQRRLRALRAQAPAPVRARRGRRGRGRPVARAPGARPVRAAADRALPRAQRRAGRARHRPRRGARALADRHALPRRGAAHPAGAPRAHARQAPSRAPTQPTRPPELSQRVPLASGLGGAAAFGALGVATGAPRCSAGSRSRRPGSPGPRSGCATAKQRMPLVLPLDAAARAVADAYRELGEMTDGGRRLAADRAARRRLPALRAGRGDARGGQALRGRARRAGERVRRAALPRLAPARRPAARRDRPARARAARGDRRSTSGCTRCPPTSPAARSAPRRSRARGAATSARAGSCSRSAARKAASCAPRPRPPDGGYETLVRDVWV